MKITVKKDFLNVMVGKPSMNAPSYQHLAPGSEIEVDGKLYNGDTYAGINTWYKDAGNNYYWSGGVSEQSSKAVPMPSIKEAFAPTINHWWITDYGIDKIWTKTKGAGVKVAVIDSGLDYNHSNIKDKKNITYYNAITGSTQPQDSLDNEGHGTMCAGMISAQGPNIYGIAPEADLLVIKATVDGDMSLANLTNAINKAVELGADIISISFDDTIAPTDPNYVELEKAVQQAMAKNVLVVASAGNTNIVEPPEDRYPASFNSCLSVGSVNQAKQLSKYTINQNIDLLGPGEEIGLLKRNNQTKTASGTSYSTPFVAAVCALYISLYKKKDPNYLINKLKADSLSKEQIKQQLTAYPNINFTVPSLGIINPQTSVYDTQNQ